MKKLLAFTFLSVIIVFCFSQQGAPNRAELKNKYAQAEKIYAKAEQLSLIAEEDETKQPQTDATFLQALKVYRSLVPEVQKAGFDSLLFYINLRTSYIAFYLNQIAPAKHDYLKAYQLKKRLPAEEDSLLFLPLIYLGGIYYSNYQFDSALYYYKQAEQIKDSYTKSLAGTQRLFNRLGAMFYETGNYFQAMNYFQKAISFMQVENKINEGLLANYRINIASCLIKLEKFPEAKKQYLGILHSGYYNNEVNHNLSIISLEESKFKDALGFLQKINYSNNRKIIQVYYNKAQAWYGLQNIDSAHFYINKALSENKKWHEDKYGNIYGLIMKFKADEAVQNQLFDSSLYYYQKAIRVFDHSFTNTDITKNPTSFSGVYSYINLFNTLIAKAHAFEKYYLKGKNIEFLKNALSTFQSAYHLADYIEKTYDSDIARLFIGKIKYTFHNKPIDISLQLYNLTGDIQYLDAGWQFDQGNKASLLHLNIEEAEWKTKIKKHPALLQKELSLKKQITRTSIQAQQMSDSSQLSKLSTAIRDLEISLYKVQEKIKALPEMKFFTKSTSIPTIAEVQKMLDPTTALISYHISEKHLIIFLIHDKTVQYKKIDYDSSFKKSIEQLRDALQYTAAGDKYAGDQAAGQLYNKLIKPIEGKLSGVKNLIIIPDDELNYIPFEALQNEHKKYLIQHFAIQYVYSASLLEKIPIQKFPAKIVSFAPFAAAGFRNVHAKDFDKIAYSKEEVEATKGKIYLDTAATKRNFIDNANQYNIIHLATHAQANNQNAALSYIAFFPSDSNSLLYAPEIYNLQLDSTQLIILSACETGAGQLIKGEGIMSLSRAFAAAGCPNVIASLWNATDKTTAFLMRQFYFYIRKGFTKSAALRHAKIDLLANNKISPVLQAPNHWAHLIFIGDYETIPSNQSSKPIFIILGILILFVFTWLFIKSKFSS